jgi:hypothetical protein
MITVSFDRSAGVYEVFTAEGEWLAAFDSVNDASLFRLGWEDHQRGEGRPHAWPDRAKGWDARDYRVAA